MKSTAFRLIPIMMLASLVLAGCAKSGGTASSTNPLMHGINQESGSVSGASGRTAQVVAASPSVVSIAGGKAEKITSGMNVPLDAILRSDATGSAKLSLPGGATVNVSPNSEVALADFIDSPEQPGESESLSDSLSKVFSGRNAKKNQIASVKNSPEATIGIRGLK